MLSDEGGVDGVGDARRWSDERVALQRDGGEGMGESPGEVLRGRDGDLVLLLYLLVCMEWRRAHCRLAPRAAVPRYRSRIIAPVSWRACQPWRTSSGSACSSAGYPTQR